MASNQAKLIEVQNSIAQGFTERIERMGLCYVKKEVHEGKGQFIKRVGKGDLAVASIVCHKVRWKAQNLLLDICDMGDLDVLYVEKFQKNFDACWQMIEPGQSPYQPPVQTFPPLDLSLTASSLAGAIGCTPTLALSTPTGGRFEFRCCGVWVSTQPAMQATLRSHI